MDLSLIWCTNFPHEILVGVTRTLFSLTKAGLGCKTRSPPWPRQTKSFVGIVRANGIRCQDCHRIMAVLVLPASRLTEPPRIKLVMEFLAY